MTGFSLSLTLAVASLSCVRMTSLSVTCLLLLPMCFPRMAESSAIVIVLGQRVQRRCSCARGGDGCQNSFTFRMIRECVVRSNACGVEGLGAAASSGVREQRREQHDDNRGP